MCLSSCFVKFWKISSPLEQGKKFFFDDVSLLRGIVKRCAKIKPSPLFFLIQYLIQSEIRHNTKSVNTTSSHGLQRVLHCFMNAKNCLWLQTVLSLWITLKLINLHYYLSSVQLGITIFNSFVKLYPALAARLSHIESSRHKCFDKKVLGSSGTKGDPG